MHKLGGEVTQSDQIEMREESLTFDKKSLQNVNFDYLALKSRSSFRKKLHSMSQRLDKDKLGADETMREELNQIDTTYSKTNKLDVIMEAPKDETDEYEERRRSLPCMVRFYLWLRSKIISPPLDVREISEMNAMLEDMVNGECTSSSVIEMAIRKDIEAEQEDLNADNLKKETSCQKMIDRFAYLLL